MSKTLDKHSVCIARYKEAVSTKADRSSSDSSSSGECEDKVLAHQAYWAKETELRELRAENSSKRTDIVGFVCRRW